MLRTDEQIRDDVIAEIAWDPRIRSTEIGVTVKDGAVTLMGTVESYREKTAAEEATIKVKGVKAIAENIEVVIPGSLKATDEKIAEQISHILQWNTNVADQDIKAGVRSGIVTLTGLVDWNFQREIARKLVSDVHGVKSVINAIKLKSRIQPADIKREITRALHRNADLEASSISVDVAGSQVTLRGAVKAWHERKLVEDAAWAAPGVTQVIDALQVR